MQPQQPHHPAAFGPAAPSSTPGAPRRRTGVVLALAAGLALGAGAVGAVWAANGAGTPAGGTAAADARAACQALDGFDETAYTEQGPRGDIAINRYAAAGALSASAAAGDARYKELAETIRRSQDGHSRSFVFDGAVKKDLDRARAICASL
ncbi:hypothetical protein ACFVU3_03320 [Streptomyces sp. NPDC058052]|uniref:hypothetical protein n=1 Tax=Streptomyces sp. NPDC058052 TaxID=3346316 RepID=UPI0036E40536